MHGHDGDYLLLLSILPVRHWKVSQEGKVCKVCHPKPKGTIKLHVSYSQSVTSDIDIDNEPALQYNGIEQEIA